MEKCKKVNQLELPIRRKYKEDVKRECRSQLLSVPQPLVAAAKSAAASAASAAAPIAQQPKAASVAAAGGSLHSASFSLPLWVISSELSWVPWWFRHCHQHVCP